LVLNYVQRLKELPPEQQRERLFELRAAIMAAELGDHELLDLTLAQLDAGPAGFMPDLAGRDLDSIAFIFRSKLDNSEEREKLSQKLESDVEFLKEARIALNNSAGLWLDLPTLGSKTVRKRDGTST